MAERESYTFLVGGPSPSPPTRIMKNVKLIRNFDLVKVNKNLGNKFWSPVDVVTINDWVLRAAAVKGEFHWHKHNDDEFFLLYSGSLTIEMERGTIRLKKGQGVVIPKGVKHCPRASKRAVVLLLEPKRLNTRGD